MPTVAIVTVGDELLCGDIGNRNAEWLAREIEEIGVTVRIIATLPDDRDSLASFVRWASRMHDSVIVTGGLGVTPDDVTRDAIADAFDVGREADDQLSSALLSRGGHSAAFAAEWSSLPSGARKLGHSPGGAPAFSIENVYVLAGRPPEMRTTFKAIREELRAGPPRATWRRRYRTTEDRIRPVLDHVGQTHSSVAVGSYPAFGARGATVEIVLRASRAANLESAAFSLEQAIAEHGIEPVA